MKGDLPEVDIGDCLANLVSYEEIAELLGVQKATAWRWRSVGVLPDPEGMLGGRAVWSRSTIVAWAHQTGRTTTF